MATLQAASPEPQLGEGISKLCLSAAANVILETIEWKVSPCLHLSQPFIFVFNNISVHWSTAFINGYSCSSFSHINWWDIICDVERVSCLTLVLDPSFFLYRKRHSLSPILSAFNFKKKGLVMNPEWKVSINGQLRRDCYHLFHFEICI